MLNAIQMGILTSSTKERLEALEEQRKELQAHIAEDRRASANIRGMSVLVPDLPLIRQRLEEYLPLE